MTYGFYPQEEDIDMEDEEEILTAEQDNFYSNKIGEKIRDNWSDWFESEEQCSEWCMNHGL